MCPLPAPPTLLPPSPAANCFLAAQRGGDPGLRVAITSGGPGSPLGCPLVPVLITSGDRPRYEHGAWRLPKRDLVIGLEVLSETGALHIAARLPEGDRLVEELTAMRVRISASGRDTYGAWREGAHDDLVLAVALACWRARLPDIGHMPHSLGL